MMIIPQFISLLCNAKYYSPEQQEYLKARKETVGDERIRQVEAEWSQLMEQVRIEMEKGSDPASESVQILARRWKSLIEEFTGGDAGITQSLTTMYQQEGPEVASQDRVVEPEASAMWDFMGKALSALEQPE
jgi:MerR family transcriptional regulator, thiopeptide resistance regulator